MFLVGFFAEIGAGLFYQTAQHRLLQFQFHLLVLHLPEFQQLVHHPQHSLAVTLYNLQLTAHTLADALVLKDVFNRCDDQSQRST